ncbi:hypothetical protein U1Q18_037521 [Sarracenia purpurea var. burkii]
MGKGGRQWLRPGDLNEYERERIKRIKENNDKVNSLQLKNIAAVFGSVQPKHASEKGKRKRVDVDDDDYMQPNSKDHSDDEFSDSFEHEVTNMPPTRRQLFNRESSSSVDIYPQSNPPTEVNVEAQASLTTSASIDCIFGTYSCCCLCYCLGFADSAPGAAVSWLSFGQEGSIAVS